MPALKFRIPEYSSASGILHTDLGADIVGFSSTGLNFRIQIGSYPDYTNILNPKTFKRTRSINNVKLYGSYSGTVLNDYLSANLILTKIPNWASTLSINFGNPTGATSYDITSAYITTSGEIAEVPEYGEVNAKPNSVRIYAAEICHPSSSTGVSGSGSTQWSSLVFLDLNTISLTRNPGPSGITAKVGSTGIPANTHDWYMALTISPLSLNTLPLMPLSCIVEYL
jgi:hypothetical protein